MILCTSSSLTSFLHIPKFEIVLPDCIFFFYMKLPVSAISPFSQFVYLQISIKFAVTISRQYTVKFWFTVSSVFRHELSYNPSYDTSPIDDQG